MGGADKGLVPWHGEPLALVVLRRLQPQVRSVLISANRNLATYRGWAPVVADPEPADYAGPLTGIHAALGTLQSEWLAVVPCDLPALPTDAVARLAAGRGGHEAAFAQPPGQTHSLVCLLHVALAPRLAAYLDGGGRRVGEFLQSVDAQAVPFDEADAFVNLNTAAELASAARP